MEEFYYTLYYRTTIYSFKLGQQNAQVGLGNGSTRVKVRTVRNKRLDMSLHVIK